MKIHRTFEVFLYGLTLLVYAFGLVFARKEGAFSLSFLFIVSHFEFITNCTNLQVAKRFLFNNCESVYEMKKAE